MRTLLTGLAFGESPRWHDDRLWFAHWGTQDVVAVDTGGRSEVVARIPTTIPFSIDWLPDGRLLAAEWRGFEHMTGEDRTGQVLTAAAPVPGAGWP
jgi:sugar lactone lactonase YvrE